MKFLILLLFLFEINRDDIWYIGAGFIAALIMAGAVAGAIKSIRGEIITPFKEKFLSPRKLQKKQLQDLIASVEEIKSEVKTNGGSSLKDSILRIEESQKQTEKSQDYFGAKLRHLDIVSPEAIFEMNEEGKCIAINPALCELVNADETELLDRNWLVKIVQSEHSRVIQEWQMAIENKCSLDSFQTIIFDKKTKIKVRVQATPRKNRDGELKGFFGRVTKYLE